jgi:hypothetical protein
MGCEGFMPVRGQAPEPFGVRDMFGVKNQNATAKKQRSKGRRKEERVLPRLTRKFKDPLCLSIPFERLSDASKHPTTQPS